MNVIGYAGYLSLLPVLYSLCTVWERVKTARNALTTLVVTIAIFIAGF